MTTPNLIIKALAGTGKTFILTSGIKGLRGQSEFAGLSNEQTQIIKTITTGESPSSILMAAFTVSAKEELCRRLGTVPNCSIRTTYGMGLRAIRQFMGISGESVTLDKHKTLRLIEIVYNGMSIHQIYKILPGYVPSVRKLVQLAKYTAMTKPSDDQLTELAGYYGVNLGDRCTQIFDTVQSVLELAKNDMTKVDFEDMPWLPVIHSLPLEKYDMVMVDEGQDLNYCQQQLILGSVESGGRVVLVGDEHQAIYGFTGADTESMYTMERKLNGWPHVTESRCKILPLTISWRCSQAVAKQAQLIVPEFRAHKDNPDGKVVHTANPQSFLPGDMVLCRTNAPLVSEAFRLVKQKIPCNLVGQDIEYNLVNLVKMLKPDSINDLKHKLSRYRDREEQRLRDQRRQYEAAIIALEDKCLCLRTFCDEADSPEKVLTLVKSIFNQGWANAVRLSSVHRAKGTEANNVFIIRPDLLPHPLASSLWQLEQEMNLKYVAVTRARHNLTFCNRLDKLPQQL